MRKLQIGRGLPLSLMISLLSVIGQQSWSRPPSACGGSFLDESIRCAISHRPEVDANEYRLEAARASLRGAWLSFLPDFRATISETTSNGTASIGSQVINGTSINGSTTIGFNIPLFDGGARYFNTRILAGAQEAAGAALTMTRNQVALQTTQVYITLVSEDYRQRLIKYVIQSLESLSSRVKKGRQQELLLKTSILNLQTQLSASEQISTRVKIEYRYLTGQEFPGNTDNLKEAILDLREKLQIPRDLDRAFGVAGSSPDLQLYQAKIEVAKNSVYQTAGTVLPSLNMTYSPYTEIQTSQLGQAVQMQGQTFGFSFIWSVNPLKSSQDIRSSHNSFLAANADYDAAYLNLKQNIEVMYQSSLPSSLDRLAKQIKAISESGIGSGMSNENGTELHPPRLTDKEITTRISSLNNLTQTISAIVASYSDIMMMQAKLLSTLGVLDNYQERHQSGQFTYDPFKALDP